MDTMRTQPLSTSLLPYQPRLDHATTPKSREKSTCRNKQLVTASSPLHDAYFTFIHSQSVLHSPGVDHLASFVFLLQKKVKETRG
jgi:hypothetical protein